MNLKQLRELETGDKVTYRGPSLTVGNEYTVTKTEMGVFIHDDMGTGHFLYDREIDFISNKHQEQDGKTEQVE